MRVIIAIVLIGLTICSFKGTHEKPLITRKFVEQSKASSDFETFDFEDHPFAGYTQSQLKSLLGLKSISLKDTTNVPYNPELVSDLPEAFDAREQWPDCIHAIRDQGQCGSCWAHAASEVLSDRLCIASNKTIDVILSPQDFVSCDYIDHGCNGGILTTSWVFLRFFGLVTDECKPYTSGTGSVAWCGVKSNCDTATVAYKKYYAKSFYWLSSIDQIKQNLYASGPVETGFSVYDDFMNYKSGIYKKGPTAKILGGHAVKIVGWGQENGTEYWIVANSWNTTWGENGFFRIAFRECGIENCIAGDPYLA